MPEKLTAYARGVMGETAAASFLEERGLRVLERRYKAGRGEIDLICLAGENILAFVEVKAREHAGTEEALLAVTAAKRRRMTEVALYYLSRHPEYREFCLRFDAVAVTREGIRHFPNAFEADFSGL